MLRSWAVRRAVFALAALNSASNPTVASMMTAQSSSPSIWRMQYSPMRLIVSVIVLHLVALERLGFLAEQVVVEQLARDRRGGSAPAAAVLDQDRHGNRG